MALDTVLFPAKWCLFDVQTSSRNERSSPSRSLLFFNLWISCIRIEPRSQPMENRIYGCVSTIARSPLPPFFLIATNLCEIVKIALILRFVILASIECFNANRLFYRSRKIEFTQNIIYYTKNKSSRLLSDYI